MLCVDVDTCRRASACPASPDCLLLFHWEAEPAKSEYHLHKAAAMCKLGTYSQAVAVCDEVIATEPSNAKAHLRKGMALVSSG